MIREELETGCILVVDDEEPVRWVLQEMITSKGYHCCVAENAAKALALLAEEPVDLSITDVNMPGMSGIELTKMIVYLSFFGLRNAAGYVQLSTHFIFGIFISMS